MPPLPRASCIAACLLAAIAMFAGCGITEPNAALADDIELAVRPSRLEIPPGDTLTITVIAYNRSQRSIDLDAGDCTPLDFEVITAGGERIGSSGSRQCGFIGTIPNWKLAPGDSLAIGHKWASIYNYGSVGNSTPSGPLPSGNYQVVGGLISVRTDAGLVKRSAAVPLIIR